MRSILISLLVFSVFSVSLKAQYQDQPTFEDTLEVYEGLFELEKPLDLTLKFNVKEFRKTRRKEEYHPAELVNHVNDTFQVTHPVRIMARGKFRRDNCTDPPYWINIRYSGIEAQEFSDVRRMKVVTRCRDAIQYKDYVLKEYLLYKIYNLISPYSFNTRLARMTYVDTEEKVNTRENWAFIIEPEEMMAKRLNAQVIKSDKLSIRTVNPEIMDLMALFQYMVGHGDYSITGRHNLKIITLKEQGPTGFIPVPYDFDYAGLVDAHYAVPGEDLGIASVKERYFLGACRPKEVHLATIQKLAEYQDEIVNLIMGFEYLDEKVRLDMVAYVATYFVESEKDRFVESSLDSTCR